MAREFPCKGCGANVAFSPGAQALKCPYCGREHRIPQAVEEVVELDFRSALARQDDLQTVEQIIVGCGGCGAEVVLAPGVTANRCSFCDNPVVAQHERRQLIQPKALLPFRVPEKDARASFDRWMKSLWFAPADLSKKAQRDGLDGVYLPFWTFDAETESWYEGERGDHYYVTEQYTVQENGQTVTRTRQVQRTRWWPASGVVWAHFDDVLVPGSHSLPTALVDRLQPWDLPSLVPFDQRYVAGFRAECYQVDLEAAFQRAKQIMAGQIRAACFRDIGGDEQRVHQVRTQHYRVTFKHVLLPLWISAYRYGDRTYRFVINAQTGEVQGDRPYSWFKIGLIVLVIVVVVLIIYTLLNL